MTYYQMPDGREAIHIGFNPEVGKEVYRVGEELIYTDMEGCVAGFPVVMKLDGKCLVLFHGGTWRMYSEQEVMEQETQGEDVAHIFWMSEASLGGAQ